MRSMRAFLLAVLALFASCGRSELSHLNRVNAVQGNLYVIPEGSVTGGQVTYFIYENGTISYLGDVSYNLSGGPGAINLEVQPSFSGTYRALPASVRSATYKQISASHTDSKVVFTVTGRDTTANTATVSALSPVENAFGELVVDVSDAFIKIKSATITGGTPIGRLTLRVQDTPPAP